MSTMLMQHFLRMRRLAVPAAKDHSCRGEPLERDRQQQQAKNDRFQILHGGILDTGK